MSFSVVEEFGVGKGHDAPTVFFIQDQSTAMLDDRISHGGMDLIVLQENQIRMLLMSRHLDLGPVYQVLETVLTKEFLW